MSCQELSGWFGCRLPAGRAMLRSRQIRSIGQNLHLLDREANQVGRVSLFLTLQLGESFAHHKIRLVKQSSLAQAGD